MLHFVLLLALIAVSDASPIQTCSQQSKCLNFTVSDCDSLGFRTVCLTLDESSPECIKDGPVSHACVAGGTKDPDGNGSEDFIDGESRCQLVVAGQNATFGVKDGTSCSGPGSFHLIDGTAGYCTGPMNVCQGGNVRECRWTFATSECSPPPPPPPPPPVCEEQQCAVIIPCSQNGCPCTSFSFVREI